MRPGSTSGQVACGDDTDREWSDTGRWWPHAPALPRLVALWGCCVYLTATMMRLAFSALLPALAAAQVCVSDISGDGEVRRTRPRSACDPATRPRSVFSHAGDGP